MQQELYDWKVDGFGTGSSYITVVSGGTGIFWGLPVTGKFGLEGDVRSTVNPKFIDSFRHLYAADVSAGYGHCTYIVRKFVGKDTTAEQSESTLTALPHLPVDESQALPSSSSSASKQVKLKLGNTTGKTKSAAPVKAGSGKRQKV